MRRFIIASFGLFGDFNDQKILEFHRGKVFFLKTNLKFLFFFYFRPDKFPIKIQLLATHVLVTIKLNDHIINSEGIL